MRFCFKISVTGDLINIMLNIIIVLQKLFDGMTDCSIDGLFVRPAAVYTIDVASSLRIRLDSSYCALAARSQTIFHFRTSSSLNSRFELLINSS